MLRAVTFIKDFNGVKGTAFVLADFFTSHEVLNLKYNYLEPSGRPIRAIGSSGWGSYGETDEVEGNAIISNFR